MPYRATVLMRYADHMGLPCEQMELVERHFAKEADAIVWCRVMTEAEPHATGVWFVACEKAGRSLTVTRENGLSAAIETPAGVELDGVLAGAGMIAGRKDLGLVA